MTKIFDFLDSLDPNLGAVYSANNLVLMTDKEYNNRLEQIRTLTTENRRLQQKVEQLELDVDSYKSKYRTANNLYLGLCEDLKQGVNIKVGDYINGNKIVNITNDMFIKGQIDIFTDATKPFGGFGDREVISYRIKKGIDKNDT